MSGNIVYTTNSKFKTKATERRTYLNEETTTKKKNQRKKKKCKKKSIDHFSKSQMIWKYFCLWWFICWVSSFAIYTYNANHFPLCFGIKSTAGCLSTVNEELLPHSTHFSFLLFSLTYKQFVLFQFGFSFVSISVHVMCVCAKDSKKEKKPAPVLYW